MIVLVAGLVVLCATFAAMWWGCEQKRKEMESHAREALAGWQRCNDDWTALSASQLHSLRDTTATLVLVTAQRDAARATLVRCLEQAVARVDIRPETRH